MSMSTNGYTDSLAAAVRLRRKELHLEQRDVAALASVSRKFLSDLERGKTSVQLDKVTAVLDALGLSLRIGRCGDPASR
jgi:HTH-type transcriptional regulator/antitoxin HipB